MAAKRDYYDVLGISMHIAKLNSRVCGAKRPHSVSEQPIHSVSM